MDIFTMNSQLIGVGYGSTRKDPFWWMTIYKPLDDDYDGIFHFINNYFKENSVENTAAPLA